MIAPILADIGETTNHFRCIDLIIDRAEDKLSEPLIKEIHRILKTGTSDSRKSWFNVGDYKKLPNEVGGNATCPPEEVHTRMKALLSAYNAKTVKTLEDIIDLHQKFEAIHPFQDGNGRVGRLIMFQQVSSVWARFRPCLGKVSYNGRHLARQF